ncbi:elongation factor P [bacterium]|nr:elongation factor P [bacterium]
MASTADFRNGMVIKYNHSLVTIVEFQHVKPGKGGAFVRTKLKDVISGKVLDNTFRAGEKVEEIRLEARQMQYLYQEGDGFVFMDHETYEQISMGADLVSPDIAKYMKEGVDFKVLFTEGSPLVLELPFFLELEIVETEPGDKGDRVSAATKPAKLETGAVVQVPLFVSQGEVVKVDTRTDEYIERVKG